MSSVWGQSLSPIALYPLPCRRTHSDFPIGRGGLIFCSRSGGLGGRGALVFGFGATTRLCERGDAGHGASRQVAMGGGSHQCPLFLLFAWDSADAAAAFSRLVDCGFDSTLPAALAAFLPVWRLWDIDLFLFEIRVLRETDSLYCAADSRGAAATIATTDVVASDPPSIPCVL